MTSAEVRKLNDEELGLELTRLREKLFQLRVQATTEKVENTAQFKLLRADIARVLTERQARYHAKNPQARRQPKPAPAPRAKPVRAVAKGGAAKPARRKSKTAAAR